MEAVQELTVDHQWWVEEARADTFSRVFGVTAGLGSGKTHGSFQWHYDRCVLNAKSQFSAYMMPTYQKIHDAAIPTARKVLSGYGFQEGEHYRFVTSPYPKIVFPVTKQEVHLLSANRPDKIVAVEYSHATISEAGSTDWEAVRLLRTRIREPSAVVRQTLLEGVPQGLNAYADNFDFNPEKGWSEYKRRDYINEKLKFRRFRLTTFDNPYVPEDYVQELFSIYGSNSNYVKSYVYGLFVPLVEGNAYGNYNPQLHDMEDIDPSPFLEIDFTWDFNANPLAWVSIQRVPFEEYGDRVHRDVAVHEGNEGCNQLDDAVVEFARKHPVSRFHQTRINLYGDSTGHHGSHKTNRSDYQAIKAYLNELGYKNVRIRALKYNPGETVSVNALNKALSEDRHYICKRCTQYRRSLMATRWQENKMKLDKPHNDDWTHHSDAVKYRFYALAETSGDNVKGFNV